MIKISTGDVELRETELVGRCGLVTGMRGSGKSYLVRVIVEQTIRGGLQTIILDPEGEFSTLREKCDLVIAGPDGDVPCEVRSAKLLARQIAEAGVSLVADMHRLTREEQFDFVADFLTTLDRLPKQLERSRLVVLDEAHLFCPESGKGRAPKAREAVWALMSQGRKRGLGAILVTQRLAKLSNDAAGEAGTIFVCGTHPIDLARAQEVLGVTTAEREALRDLPRGQCFATGSALFCKGEKVTKVVHLQVRKAMTTHPEPGTRASVKPVPPRAAIKQVLEGLAALPPSKEAEDAASLADAQKRIRELERQLKAAPAAAPATKTVEKVVVDHAAIAELGERWTAWAATAATLADGVRNAIANADKSSAELAKHLRHPPSTKVPKATKVNGTSAPPPRAVARSSSSSSVPVPEGGKKLRSGARKMLAAIARHGPIKKRKLALIVGLAQGGGTFGTYLGELRGLGYCTVHLDVVDKTDAGVAAAGGAEPLPRGDELVELWCAHPKVRGRTREILRTIVAAGADGIGKAELAASVGLELSGGTFGTYCGILRTLELIEGSDPIHAADVLLG